MSYICFIKQQGYAWRICIINQTNVNSAVFLARCYKAITADALGPFGGCTKPHESHVSFVFTKWMPREESFHPIFKGVVLLLFPQQQD